MKTFRITPSEKSEEIRPVLFSNAKAVCKIEKVKFPKKQVKGTVVALAFGWYYVIAENAKQAVDFFDNYMEHKNES